MHASMLLSSKVDFFLSDIVYSPPRVCSGCHRDKLFVIISLVVLRYNVTRVINIYLINRSVDLSQSLLIENPGTLTLLSIQECSGNNDHIKDVPRHHVDKTCSGDKMALYLGLCCCL